MLGLGDFWTVLFVGGMFILFVIEVIQICNKFGNPLINVLQALVYLGIIIVYWVNVSENTLSLGMFLRLTTFLFVMLFFFDVLTYPKEEGKRNKWLVLLSFIKLFPLVGIIFKLTAHLM
jgi:hypothetical protein